MSYKNGYKLSIVGPDKICDICKSGALYNVKNNSSHKDQGYAANHLDDLTDEQMDLFFTRLKPYFEDGKVRKPVRAYQLQRELCNDFHGATKDIKGDAILAKMNSLHEYCQVFGGMIRTLEKIDHAAFKRRIDMRNRLYVKRNAMVRVYPTCWWVCSETCLNLLILKQA